MNSVLRRARWRPPAGILSRRFLSAPTSLVSDDEVAALASRAQHPISLADLVKHGRPPLSDEALLASANFTLSVLPVRLARRIRAIRNLPFIVVSNPNVGKIHRNYADSLSALLPFLAAHPLRTLVDEARFADTLADLVVTHQDTIPILARGFLECRRYIDPADVTGFLDEHLRARIGTRLVAEQHISLHNSSRRGGGTVGRGAFNSNNGEIGGGQAGQADGADDGGYIGVIDTALRPSWVVEACAGFVADIAELRYGVRPALRVDGEVNTTFAFVPMHLSYMVTELLKNAFRASVESGRSREPVIVTIAPEQGSATPPLRPGGGGSDGNAAPGVTIRIRDRGGGIAPDVLPNIWSYSYTTVPEDDDNDGGGGLLSPSGIIGAAGGGGGGGGGASPTGLGAISAVSASAGASSIAGLGYGLPLSRAYAEYFGGGITVQSLHGWGTDVYLRLKGVGASPASGA